jgi:hypothetical protein
MRSESLPSVAYYLIALAAFSLPIAFRGRPSMGTAVHISFALSALWIAALAFGFVQSDRRMPRMMLALPFALCWPTFGLVAEVICRCTGDCI